jgi:ketosteroid isomerase-like protein
LRAGELTPLRPDRLVQARFAQSCEDDNGGLTKLLWTRRFRGEWIYLLTPLDMPQPTRFEAETKGHPMSDNTRTVNRYLDGFRTNDHGQILSCLTDDIEWRVFGGFHLTGKEAYDAAIEGPGFVPPPQLEVVRMVEQDDVVMAELVGSVRRDNGEVMRMSMAEVFVMRDGKIAERRAWVVELTENDFR